MALPSLNFHNLEPIDQYYDTGRGIDNGAGLDSLLSNILKGYGMSREPARMRAEEEKARLANILQQQEAQYNPEYYQSRNKGQRLLNEEREMSNAIKRANGQEEADLELEKKWADLEHRGAQTEKERAIAKMGGKRYAPTSSAKTLTDLKDAKEGFLPGSNRTVTLDPEEQQLAVNQIELELQKRRSDTDTRKRALFAKNLVQSMDSADINALTKYSGPKGQAEYRTEQAKDLIGLASEDYMKHKEAKKAVALEAQELRQFLGTSITPTMDKALREMVDATSIATSPETAKRMIEKSRSIIRKQMETYQNALESKEPYEKQDSSKENSSGTIKMYRKGEDGQIYENDIPRNKAGEAALRGWYENEK